MHERRVGFLGEDDALVVDLVLRGGGLAVVRVDDVAQLAGVDVALLAVPPGADAAALVRVVPPGPTIVLLTHERRGVPGTAVVVRPCSLRTLVDVLGGTGSGDVDGDLVITLGRPSRTPAPPLFTAAGESPSRSDSSEDPAG